jgi:hypothetical protein
MSCPAPAGEQIRVPPANWIASIMRKILVRNIWAHIPASVDFRANIEDQQEINRGTESIISNQKVWTHQAVTGHL